MTTIPDLDQIIFLDIETVPSFRSISELPEDLRMLWKEQNSRKKKKKSEEDQDNSDDSENEFNYDRAGLSAEFGKVICISIGRFEGGSDDQNLKVTSVFSDDEKDILLGFAKLLAQYPESKLCAHNGKAFDFPFLAKRYLINDLPLPAQLNMMDMKPWDVPHIDTNELWAFGSRRAGSGAKLKLLCALFGIPSPKDDIDGSDVRRVYYEEKDLARIVRYCEKDIVSLARVYKKIRGIR